MRRLREHVVAYIRTHALWQPGERVALAVSGGRDSVVLLDVLAATRGIHGAVLSVVTVDHGTRSGSADDAVFVEELANSYGLPCSVHTVALGPNASEQACRDARQSAFLTLDVDWVATGHHARDHAETLLIRLLRGTGPRGLGGLRPKRDHLVRPLLDVPHEDVAHYANQAKLAFREDPTNVSPAFLRNRVRHELLPLLESLRPGSVAAVARTARLASEESEWLDALVDDVDDVWSCEFLGHGPMPAVRRAVLKHEPSLRHVHVDAIRALAQRGVGHIQLPNGRLAIADSGRVRTCTKLLNSSSLGTGGACDT